MNIDIVSVLNAMYKKEYTIFESSSKPYRVNIVAVRNTTSLNNDCFNDLIFQFYRDNGKLISNSYTCTTDPGDYYRTHLLNEDGTAILVPGQYLNMHKVGLHKGKYEALIQVNKCKVFRDYDKDVMLDCICPTDDYNLSKSIEGTTTTFRYYRVNSPRIIIQEGLFGINIHDLMGGTRELEDSIGKYSAGCTVFNNHKDHVEFMRINKLATTNFSNLFTYTLLLESDLI